MYKSILPAALAALLINFVCYAPVAADSKSKDAESVAEIKAAVKIGANSGTPVKVRLRDETKLKGYISEANEEDFVIVNYKTGTTTRLTYLQVKHVKGIKSRRILTVGSLGYIGTVALIILTGIGYARK